MSITEATSPKRSGLQIARKRWDYYGAWRGILLLAWGPVEMRFERKRLVCFQRELRGPERGAMW
jgi:hypothetical protein